MCKELLMPRDDIFIIRHFLSAEECDRFLSWSEMKGYGDAMISTSLRPIINKAMRSNDRVVIDDATEVQSRWEKLRDFVSPIGRW